MPDPQTDLPSDIIRINALTTKARNTWFVLLGVLVFVGVTLMSVDHIDFYGVDRATKLPLVDVDVPTKLFFIAAPILTLAIYSYFHLYLIRLWDALGKAKDEVSDMRLGDAITPWLVSDAALHLRKMLRKDNCTTPRALDLVAMLLNVFLAWGLSLIILLALWLMSMVARNATMAVVNGLMLLAAGWVGLASWLVMWRRMRGLSVTDKRAWWSWAALGLGGAAAIAFVGVISLERSSATLGLNRHAKAAEKAVRDWLARNDPPAARDRNDNTALPDDFWFSSLLTLGLVNLVGEALVEKPGDWLPHDIARSEFRPKWCAREGLDCKALTDDQTGALDAEWTTRRRAQIDALGKPEVNGINPTQYREWTPDLRAFARAGGLNLRNADLRDAFLPGMNLVGADLTDAQLRGANLEGADLYEARMEGANLWGAQMEGANLSEARMERADLGGALMEGADLSGARMEGANLSAARMEGADLSGARMEGAVLWGARMEGADLRRSRIFGLTHRVSALTPNLSASTNEGGAIRLVDLSDAVWDAETDFRDAFLDASVTVPDAFTTRMGSPCQWVDTRLSDTEFMSVWAWWLDQLEIGRFLQPSDIRNIPRPAPDRLAELGLTDCKPNQPFGPMPASD